MIEGEHKIVRLEGSEQWELYDLANDRTETSDLAHSDAARLQAMIQAWETWYASVDH